MRIASSAAAAVVGIVLLAVAGVRLLGGGSGGDGPGAVSRSLGAADPLVAAVRDFDPGEIVKVIPQDAIRPIDRPEYDAASRSTLQPQELVIGVELRGQARAYPIRVLSAHEIVNDEIGGQPFLVTW